MALHYDYSKIKESTKTWEPDENWDGDGEPLGQMTEVLHTLIWTTMSIGMGEITEENWKAFYTRMKLIGSDRSLLRRDKDGNYTVPISSQEVKDHIGLMTNADTLTKLQFLKRAYRVVNERVED